MKLPWWAYLLVAAAVAGIGWKVNGWRNDAAAYALMRPAYDGLVAKQSEANERVEKLAPVDAAARVQLEQDRAALAAEQAKVSRAWQRIKAVQESPDEDGHVVVRLSDAWGVCFSAAATGAAADLAACAAAGGDGAGAAGPGG